MRPRQLIAHLDARSLSFSARGISVRSSAVLFLLVGATMLASCGGDSTGIDKTAGLPAAGRWDARVFDSENVPNYDYVGPTGTVSLDSVWHMISGDGSTRLFVAMHDDEFVATVDTIEGQFVRANDEGTIQLLYKGTTGDPYPPSPVTVDHDTITVEDGFTQLIDVYVRRK